MKTNYVYYSYEEWGRGYIGVKFNSDPETDGYYGTYYDKTFSPSQKIVLGCFETKEEALEAEVALHRHFQVDKTLTSQINLGKQALNFSTMLRAGNILMKQNEK